MLSKPHRTPRALFGNVLKKSKQFHSPHFTLRVSFLPREEKVSKFSFVTPASVSKKAVERNLLRRRGYAVIRKNLDKIKTPCLGGFFSKKGAASLKFQELEKEITDLLRQSNLI